MSNEAENAVAVGADVPSPIAVTAPKISADASEVHATQPPAQADGDLTGLEAATDEELARASAKEDEDNKDEKTKGHIKKVVKRKSDPNRQMLPVRPQETWKYAKSSHPRCNGKGYLIVDEHDKEALALKVPVLDGKGEPTGERKIEYRHTCQCAITGFKRENETVLINGHLFWPPASPDEPVAVADPDAKESPMDRQMREAKESDRERKLARVLDLRKEAEEAEVAASRLGEEIAVLVGPEQKQLKDLHEGDNFLSTSLAALASDSEECRLASRRASGEIVDGHNAAEQEIARIRREADEAVDRVVADRKAKREELEVFIKAKDDMVVVNEEHRVKIGEERKQLARQIATVESEITRKAGRLRRKQGEKVRLASQLRVRAQRIEERNQGGE